MSFTCKVEYGRSVVFINTSYNLALDTGWNKNEKLKELKEKEGEYFVLYRKNQMVAFVYYMITVEECGDLNDKINELDVVYCYELQVIKEYQGFGIGNYLLNLTEEKGKLMKTKKSVLTVFKTNKTAIDFYTKKGYSVDLNSPSKCIKSELKKSRISYEIFSKFI